MRHTTIPDGPLSSFSCALSTRVLEMSCARITFNLDLLHFRAPWWWDRNVNAYMTKAHQTALFSGSPIIWFGQTRFSVYFIGWPAFPGSVGCGGYLTLQLSYWFKRRTLQISCTIKWVCGDVSERARRFFSRRGLESEFLRTRNGPTYLSMRIQARIPSSRLQNTRLFLTHRRLSE